MKIKKRKKIHFLKFNLNRFKLKKIRSKFLPICFAITITISTFIDNSQNHCKADNNRLYYIIQNIRSNTLKLEVQPNKIIDVDPKEYIIGVTAGEMPASFDDDAIMAQMIAAKNYVLFHLVNQRLKNNGKIKPISNNQMFQVYLTKEKRKEVHKSNFEKIEKRYEKLFELVKDKFVFYTETNKKNKTERLANTVYFSESSGKTENAKNIWGTDIPYLKSVDSSFEYNNKTPEKKVEKTYDELFNIIKKYNTNATMPEKKENSIKIESKNETNHVKAINAFGISISGNDFRKICKLPSTHFEIENDNDKLIFKCKGFGHDIGMSQRGANELAKKGKKYDEILKHYYTGVEVKNIDEIKNDNFEIEIKNDETLKTVEANKNQQETQNQINESNFQKSQSSSTTQSTATASNSATSQPTTSTSNLNTSSTNNNPTTPKNN